MKINILRKEQKRKGRKLMKFRTIAIIFAFLACATISKADITSWYCADDGDGVIKDTITSWSEIGAGEYEMTIDTRHDLWEYGHMVGWFVSDGDPTITVIDSIDNDTDFPWTDYHLNIYMDHPFTIVPLSAFVITPSDWNPNSVITPVSGTGPYVGSIDYYAGTAVPVAGTLMFGYKISYTFSGKTSYTQEMLPTPEPGTIVLLALGLLGLFVLRRRFA